jgi:hypothetical protein
MAEVEVIALETDNDIHTVLPLPDTERDPRGEAICVYVGVGLVIGEDVSELSRELRPLLIATRQYRVTTQGRITWLDRRRVRWGIAALDPKDLDLRGPSEYAGSAVIETGLAPSTAKKEQKRSRNDESVCGHGEPPYDTSTSGMQTVGGVFIVIKAAPVKSMQLPSSCS